MKILTPIICLVAEKIQKSSFLATVKIACPLLFRGTYLEYRDGPVKNCCTCCTRPNFLKSAEAFLRN